MVSVADRQRISSALEELRGKSLGDYSFSFDGSKDFEDAIEYPSIFVDCIRHWIDTSVLAPHLGSLAAKIEASVRKIGGEFIKEFKRRKRPRPNVFSLSGIQDERDLTWRYFFEKWKAMIDVLKPEIAEACDSVSIAVSVKYNPPLLDFYQWKTFVTSMNFLFPDVNGNSIFPHRLPSGVDIRFLDGQSISEVILDFFEDDDLKNPKIEAFLVKVGSSITSAGMLSCQWWAKNFDPSIKEDVDAAFRDVEQNVGLTNPDIIDIIFGELNAAGQSSTIAGTITYCLIPLARINGPEYSVCYALRSELEYLVTTVLNMPEEGAFLQIFLPDIKQLVMETASHHHSLFNVKHRNVIMDLFGKVCLIKVEIFLRTQLVADNVFKGMVFDMKEAISLSEAEGSERSKYANQILMLLKEVAIDVQRYQQSALSLLPKSPLHEGINKERLRLRLLLKTLLLKGELLFLKLHDKLLPSFKDRTEDLHLGFKIMIPLVIKDEKLKFADVEVVATRIISLYHRMLNQDISEEMLRSLNRSVSDLVDELKFVIEQFKKIHPRVLNSDFPKTNAAGFIDSLMRKLQDLLNCGMDFVESVISKRHIAEIMGHLQFFKTFLGGNSSMEVSNLGGRVIDMCYEAEYLIDSAIHGKEDELHNIVWLYYFLQEIREIKFQVGSTREMSNKSVKKRIISRTTTPNIDEDLVNLIDQEEMVIEKLIGGFEELFTVSIVGMPGIGKTTLAKKVYNSPEVVSRFRIRAWCCVSEIYRKRDVLLEILSCIIALTGDIMGMTVEDLEFKLYKILKTGKYLIVLDDVWDSDVLDDLVKRFPDNKDGSRILVTSRHNNVALKANPNADPHHLRQLSDSESWKLLQKKIFREKPCPEEFKDIGKKIAGSCKGLPLAVIAIAGLLERIELQHDRWNDIAQSLSSQILDDPQEQWRYILELSYENLPDCLKACFLYFGAFLEDQDIPVRKLMQLWIAEGFVPEIEFKTMEDVAEDYLMDLIGRNLVTLSKQRSRAGGAKACRIHDVLRKLCQSKAKEDKFMQVITMSDASNNADLHDLDYVFSANFGNPSSSAITYEDHRLCFCSKSKHFIDSRPSGPHVRSLLCFATGEEDPRYPSDISFIHQNFRFLKVLDLECINIGNSFPQDILLLLQLRYLAVSGYIDFVPESIANLRNLETLIVKGLRGKVNLPHTIFELKKLRHVCVNDFAAIKFRENSGQLDFLVAISSLILPFGKETDYVLTQFPNLKKLKCIFSESHLFPNLEVLNQLESLKVTYYGRLVDYQTFPGEFGFNSNLKKLTLSNFRLPWVKISAIGRLPNLEVLKLLSRAFVGEEWEMDEGEFVGLKYLKLENLDVSRWNANGDCLPKLQQLVLRSCKNLEIPVDIVEAPALRIIDVRWCGSSAEKSARRIREDGDEMLKVFINFAELPVS